MASENTGTPEEKLALEMNNGEHISEIKKWWFDDTLYLPRENSAEQIRTELKQYYAFIQIFYHENFRESNTEIDTYLKELIEKVESDERYLHCQEREKKLKNLVLGSAYRRLGQFKTERYQSAEAEHVKAKYYLEQDTFFLEFADPVDTDAEENFVITLLFLLNKAKYFRDIAEKDVLREDSGYCRAVMLFQEIRRKIEEWQKALQGAPLKGIFARIYVNAWINIAQVYRLRQEIDLTPVECSALIRFCINSMEDEKKKEEIQKIIKMLPELSDKDQASNRIDRFTVKNAGRDNSAVDSLFEDYILQALLQLGIFYRDRVDFNGSRTGNLQVRQAINVFLALGVVDCIKDNKETKSIEALLAALPEQNLESRNESEEFMRQVKNICESNELKNQDAQNNLAVCLKKLKYYAFATKILTAPSLDGNKFAEYNLCKCYLESGVTEKKENIRRYFHDKSGKNDKHAYIYPEEPEKSNYKWLFLYARYLFSLSDYDAAEKLFSLIRSSRTMQWDSLELKAAYLEAQCQMQRGKYLSAITSLRNIHDSLLKLDNERSARRHEIRTEIDLGWCLIMEDRYREALDVYRDLLTYLVWDKPPADPKSNEIITLALEKLKQDMNSPQSPSGGTDQSCSMKWHTVSGFEQKMILHNLFDCWSYLNTYDNDVSRLIKELCEPDPAGKPDVYMQFLESLRIMNQLKRSSGKEDTGIEQKRNVQEDTEQKELCGQWKKLSDAFGAALQKRPLDTITYSCWVIGMINYCLQLFSLHPEQISSPKKQLLAGLVSSTTPITMKCYIEVAQIILYQDGNNRFLDIGTETKYKEGMELERAFLELFCHVNLRRNGTNQAFMKLMTDQNFHSIELVTRARLLADIVELYGDILQMKTRLRITYDNLREISRRKRDDGLGMDEQPIICQYTRLSTLKGILPGISRGAKGDAAENEPRFRMSNAARMNDTSEGSVFKKICEKLTDPEKTGVDPMTYQEIIRKYIDNSSGYKSADEISSYDSDVYLASFSMNRDNFGLWSNYADKEKGCIIGFDQSFFDLVDHNGYSILDDEAEENALYRILYVDERKLFQGAEDLGIKTSKENERDKPEKSDIEIIRTCIPHILQKLSEIEEMLQDTGQGITPEAAGTVRAFIVDRLNEIRFLFKSVSYEYEEEVRMLRCSLDPEVDGSDQRPVPWLYINVEKKLDNLTLILGSRVDLQQVKELSVWAKSTGRVKQVIWSGLNRL